MIFDEITVEQAGPADADKLGALIYAMEREQLCDETLDISKFQQAARAVLTDTAPNYWVYFAKSDGEYLGVVTLAEKRAIYAGGPFGEIIEFYVVPSGRCAGIGKRLLAEAARKGHEMGWPFLEVGAPRMPCWKTCLTFYLKNGFREIGPRLERGL